MRFFRIGAMLCFLTILASFSNIPLNGGNADDIETRGGEGVNPYCTFNIRGFPSYIFYGQDEDFYIRVANTYDGRLWIDDNHHHTKFYIYEAVLSLEHDYLVHDRTEKTYTNVIQLSETGSLTPDNGYGKSGFNIFTGDFQDFYRDNLNQTQMGFSLGTTGFPEGSYRFMVSLSFKVRTGYDGAAPDGFKYSSILKQSGYILAYFNSRINDISEGDINLRPYEEGSFIPVYSGATGLKMRMDQISSYQDMHLHNLKATISFTGDDFTFSNTNILYTLFDETKRTPIWDINVSYDAKPGIHHGNLFFEYTYLEIRYREGPYITQITVANTPILTPMVPLENEIPIIEIHQKQPIDKFEVPMVNTGNLRLEKVLITMNIERSKYISKTVKYFHEGEESKQIIEPAEFEAKMISPGDSINAEFDDLIISMMIPPGDYLITFDYTAEYINPNDPAGSTLKTQQISGGRQDFNTFNYYRSLSRPEEQIGPYFILRVLDNEEGPDLVIDSNIILTPGSKNNLISFEFQNKELYELWDLDYYLISEDPGKIWNSDSSEISMKLDSDFGLVVPQASRNGPGVITITSMVDVKDDIESQTCYLQLKVIFRDHRNRRLTSNLTVPVYLVSEHGHLEIISMKTNEVIPGDTFTVELEIMNTGGTRIEDYSLRLVSRDNSVNVMTHIQMGEFLEPGETQKVTFMCEAKEHMEKGRTCTLTALSSYLDKDGNAQNNTLMENRPLIVASTEIEEKDELPGSVSSGAMLIMISIIAVGIILAVTLFLSARLLTRSPKPRNGEKIETKKEEIKGGGDILMTNFSKTSHSDEDLDEFMKSVLKVSDTDDNSPKISDPAQPDGQEQIENTFQERDGANSGISQTTPSIDPQPPQN